MRPGVEFEAFVAEAGPGLLRTAVFISGSKTDAEDLLQLALLRTFRRWSVAQAAPTAYTRKVLVNLVHDRRRWLARRPPEVTAPDHDGYAVSAGFEERHLERAAVLQALRALPARQRVVVALRYLEDRPIAEVAQLLTCSEGAVKALAGRALRQLRVDLSDQPEPTEVRHAR